MGTYRSLRLLHTVPALLLFVMFCYSLPALARPADPSLDEQVMQATVRAVQIAQPGASDQRLTIRRRQDLEDLLWNSDENKPVGQIYFYEMQPLLRTGSDGGSPWVVAVARSPRGVYDLYNFAPADGPDVSRQEFNRLISELGLSIPKEKATGVAKLFLESCDAGELGQIVADPDGTGIRLAVEDYYFAAYGDLWRALDEYLLWWRGFQATAPAFESTASARPDGSYRVGVKRLVTIAGAHPQIQDLELEISTEGNVRVVTIQAVFPKQPSWLFYQAPAAIPANLMQ